MYDKHDTDRPLKAHYVSSSPCSSGECGRCGQRGPREEFIFSIEICGTCAASYTGPGRTPLPPRDSEEGMICPGCLERGGKHSPGCFMN
jgi:hypothetical protein